MGCYSGTMEVAEFPAVLPKLCIVCILQGPTEPSFRNIKLVVLKDDEQLIEGELPVPEFPKAPDNTLRRFEVQFVLSPFTVEVPCTLRVRAHVDGEEIRGLALAIKKTSESTMPGKGRTQPKDPESLAASSL